MFGQGHPGHQQQQQRRPPSHSQWAAQADAVPCAQYLCPDTLVCVSNPVDCPCPSVEDVKCLIPDAEDKDAATVTCVRESNDCSAVEQLYKRYTK
ncbi:hypothetical protein PHLGIDRAFT_84622 [Phlebiopsis gigantea 11061_1 CR5-6]|uniref:Long chronological lifespan protein 2 n=1 Tax=Phlebiopsis gigantea (strain 11061_1 CR5-6) TaxID=745531 RepID=A0A0C3S4H3_PHLG1|nr:hypothetical protein PHLGIDRAFT_84622 [Phlebiopsis gigantea 11061_1 CR5-6]